MCSYLNGILTFEIYQDWAKAERIFVELLHGNAEALPRGRLLHALGRTLEKQGRWPEAIYVYEQALALADTLTQPMEKVKAWKHLAICRYEEFASGYQDTQTLAIAIEHCQQALNTLTLLSDSSANVRWLEGPYGTRWVRSIATAMNGIKQPTATSAISPFVKR